MQLGGIDLNVKSFLSVIGNIESKPHKIAIGTIGGTWDEQNTYVIWQEGSCKVCNLENVPKVEAEKPFGLEVMYHDLWIGINVSGVIKHQNKFLFDSDKAMDIYESLRKVLKK